MKSRGYFADNDWEYATQSGTGYPGAINLTYLKVDGIIPESGFIIGDFSLPYVVSTTPQNNATNVEKDIEIVIKFSESMNKNTTESAISIVPGMIISKIWDKNNTSLKLVVSLSEGTTYLVNISKKAEDLAGNHMQLRTLKNPPPQTTYSSMLYPIAMYSMEGITNG